MDFACSRIRISQKLWPPFTSLISPYRLPLLPPAARGRDGGGGAASNIERKQEKRNSHCTCFLDIRRKKKMVRDTSVFYAHAFLFLCYNGFGLSFPLLVYEFVLPPLPPSATREREREEGVAPPLLFHSVAFRIWLAEDVNHDCNRLQLGQEPHEQTSQKTVPQKQNQVDALAAETDSHGHNGGSSPGSNPRR